MPGILGAGGEIGDLAGNVDLDRHHGDLVGDAREIDQRLAELDALLGVAQGQIHRALGDADAAGGGLDARQFEGLHQLLEALALLAAEQIFGRNDETVEADLEFLHAAVAEHFDLAARHAGDRERIGRVAARLFGEQHRQALVARLRRIGAGEQGHHDRRAPDG